MTATRLGLGLFVLCTPFATPCLGFTDQADLGVVSGLALSPDGRLLASVAKDGDLHLWDTRTGKLLRRIPNVGGSRNWVVFSPDSKRIVTVTDSRLVRVVNVETGLGRYTFKGPGGWGSLRAVAFTPDGKILFSAGYNDPPQLCDLDSGKALTSFGEVKNTRVTALAVTPNGQFLAAAISDEPRGKQHSLQLYNIHSGLEIYSFRGIEESVNAVSFSPDGRMLIATSSRGIRGWEVLSGQEMLRLHCDGAALPSFSPNGRILAVASGPYVDVWNLPDGRRTRRFLPDHGPVTALAFLDDGKKLVAGNSRLHWWDLSTADGPSSTPPHIDREIFSLPAHPKGVRTILFSPDGQSVLTGSDDGLMILSDTTTGRPIRRWDALRDPEHYGRLSSTPTAAFSPDGRTLVSSSPDNVVRFWDPVNGKLLRTLEGHELRPGGVAFTPDGKALATAGHDRNVRLWDVRTGTLLRSFEAHGFAATGVVFSRDGKALYTGGIVLNRTEPRCIIRESDDVRAWDTATWKELPRPGGKAHQLSLSPDGKTLALSTVVALYYPGGGKGTHRYKDMGLDTESRITLRDLTAGEDRFTLKRQGPCFAFSPDGVRGAAGSFFAWRETDNSWGWNSDRKNPMVLDDLKSGRLQLNPPHEDVTAVAFSPDGSALVTGSSHGTVHMWDVTPNRSALKARAKARSNLSRKALTDRWEALGGTDGHLAYRAIWDLSSAKDEAASLLGERLSPREPVSAGRLAALIERLDSKSFPEREKAAQELTSLGRLVEDGLREALKNPPTLETRRRIELILTNLDQPPNATALRALRAIAALEAMATDQARELLERLAKGATKSHETDAASAALARLNATRR